MGEWQLVDRWIGFYVWVCLCWVPTTNLQTLGCLWLLIILDHLGVHHVILPWHSHNLIDLVIRGWKAVSVYGIVDVQVLGEILWLLSILLLGCLKVWVLVSKLLLYLLLILYLLFRRWFRWHDSLVWLLLRHWRSLRVNNVWCVGWYWLISVVKALVSIVHWIGGTLLSTWHWIGFNILSLYALDVADRVAFRQFVYLFVRALDLRWVVAIGWLVLQPWLGWSVLIILIESLSFPVLVSLRLLVYMSNFYLIKFIYLFSLLRMEIDVLLVGCEVAESAVVSWLMIISIWTRDWHSWLFILRLCDLLVLHWLHWLLHLFHLPTTDIVLPIPGAGWSCIEDHWIIIGNWLGLAEWCVVNSIITDRYWLICLRIHTWIEVADVN